MLGRKPVPTALKVLRGNPGHRPINPSEPKPRVAIPPAPKELDPIAKKEWRRMGRVLARLGLLTEIDRAAFAGYCVSWSTWITAQQKVQQMGSIAKAPSGYPIQNPYIGIANTALTQLRAFLVEFGLTPASRSRVTAANPLDDGDSADPWEGVAADG